MKELIRKNKAFLLPYLLFLIAGATLFLTFNKGELHLALNVWHNSIFDQLFYYITFLGDFFTPLALFCFFLFIRYRYALLLMGGNLLAAGVTQALKHTFFSDVVRPKMYFQGSDQIKLVDGVENWLYNSFPSGHTTCAFATFFCLALLTDTPLNKFLFFAFALTVGYSRVYLSQHFFDDIYAGSIVGTVCMGAMYLLVQRSKNVKLEGSLIRKAA